MNHLKVVEKPDPIADQSQPGDDKYLTLDTSCQVRVEWHDIKRQPVGSNSYISMLPPFDSTQAGDAAAAADAKSDIRRRWYISVRA